MTIDNALTSKRKVVINLSIIDNFDALSLIHNPYTRYSAARQDTGTRIKYFNAGIDLIPVNEFKRRYREVSTYQPKSNWVLLMSLSGDVEPNGSFIVRSRNRTALVVSVTLDSITEGIRNWPDPGLSLDYRQIDYRTTHINWRENKVSIRGNLPSGLDLNESPNNYITLFRRTLDHSIAQIKEVTLATHQDPYSTEEGREMMLEYCNEVLTFLGIHNESAISTRDRLIEMLKSGVDPHAYIHKGVAFPSETVFNNRMATCDNNEEYVLREQHDRPLVEAMLVEFPSDDDIPNRLRKMDRAMLEHKMFRATGYVNVGTTLDFMLGLTNDEYTQVYHSKDEAYIEQMRKTVIKRWEDANRG